MIKVRAFQSDNIFHIFFRFSLFRTWQRGETIYALCMLFFSFPVKRLKLMAAVKNVLSQPPVKIRPYNNLFGYLHTFLVNQP